MFSQFKQKKYPIVFVDGVSDTDIERGIQNVTWDEFKEQMSQFIRTEKKDVQMFLPVQFKPKAEWVEGDSNLMDGNKKKSFRNSNNITHVSMAVIDLDADGAVQQARKKFKDFEYLIYSTFSYSPETPYKFRMILPFENPVPVEQWERTFVHLMAGIEGDYACKNTSRGYYSPSVNTAVMERGKFAHQAGRTISVDAAMELGEQFMDTRASDALKKIEAKGNVTVATKLHPSGEAKESGYSGDSLSYEAFLRRHKAKVENNFDGGKGNRHNFAMEVLNSEIGIFKEKVRLDLMIEFIYKATLENSSKPLSTGNTGSELNEMISSAMNLMIDQKYMTDPAFTERATELMKKGIESSLKAEKTGKWSFKSYNFEPEALGNSLGSFKSRYFREIDAYVKESQDIVVQGNASAGDVRKAMLTAFNEKIVTPVVYREMVGNTRFDIQSMGMFFLNQLEEHNLGPNPQSNYLGLCNSLSGYIAKSGNAAIQALNGDQEAIYEQLAEVTAILPLLQLKQQENKQAYRRRFSRRSDSEGYNPK